MDSRRCVRPGLNASPSYDGSAFARDGVVLVSINYRLGTYGWLPVDARPPISVCATRSRPCGGCRTTSRRSAATRQCHDLRRVGRRYERCRACSSARRRVAVPARPSCRAGTGFRSRCPTTPAGSAPRLPRCSASAHRCQALAEVDPSALIDALTAIDNAIRLAPDPGRWGATTIGRGGITGHIPVFDELIPEFPQAAVAAGASAGVPLLLGTTGREFTCSVWLPEPWTDHGGALPVVATRFGAGPDVVAAYVANHAGADAAHVFDQIASDAFFRKPHSVRRRSRTRRGSTHVHEFAGNSGFRSRRLPRTRTVDRVRRCATRTRSPAPTRRSRSPTTCTRRGSLRHRRARLAVVRLRWTVASSTPAVDDQHAPGRPISPRGVVPDRSRGRHRVVTSSAAFGRRRRLPMAGRK